MSSDELLATNGRFTLAPGKSIYYFDFKPVLALSPALRRDPERLSRMCASCVSRIAPDDTMLARDEGFYLVIQSSVGAEAGVIAQTINIALLELFFGTDSLTGLTSICRPAGPIELDALGRATEPDPGVKHERKAARIHSWSGDNADPDPLAFLALRNSSADKKLETGYLPIINVQNDTAPIFLCGPTLDGGGRTGFGVSTQRHLSAAERAEVDEALLLHTAKLAQQVVPILTAKVIGTSVSYETLANPKTRQPYQRALRGAHLAKNPFFLLKIESVPSGTPPTRLAEIVSFVRPFVKRVFLELPDWEHKAIQSGNLGVSGLVAALPLEISRNELGALLTSLNRAAAWQHALVCITGVSRVGVVDLLRRSGVRFVAMCASANKVQIENHLELSSAICRAA